MVSALVRCAVKLLNLTPKERKAAYDAAYRALPENKARQAAYRALPGNKARKAAYQAAPENKARRAVWLAAYDAVPENKARRTARLCNVPIEIPYRPRPERCECCGGTSERALHFDHCHDSGRFRGWCCHRCNSGAGIADNPKLLRLRTLYIERPFKPGPINWAYPTNWKEREARHDP